MEVHCHVLLEAVTNRQRVPQARCLVPRYLSYQAVAIPLEPGHVVPVSLHGLSVNAETN